MTMCAIPTYPIFDDNSPMPDLSFSDIFCERIKKLKKREKEQEEYIANVMQRALDGDITVDRSIEILQSAFAVLERIKQDIING